MFRLSFLMALTGICLWPTLSRAQDAKYATFEIYNATKNPVRYSVRWGDGKWQETTLKPGAALSHWYPFNVPNENKSPTPEITFNTEINGIRNVLNYGLSTTFTPDKTGGGKPYHFDLTKGKERGSYVDLFSGVAKIEAAAKNVPVIPPADRLAGSSWKGKETLPGYGDLAVRLQEGGQAVMTDKDGDTKGTWAQNGKSITLKFGNTVTYTGTLEGNALSGSATNGKNSWTFALANSRVFAGDSALVEQGRDLVNKGEYDQALAKFNAAIQADPKNALVYTRRAYAYWKKGTFDKALADCAEAIRLNPDTGNAYNVRALVYREQGDDEEALKEHTKAIQLAPKDARFYANRGSTYAIKKKWEEVIADYSEAIRLDPKELSYLDYRGSVYMSKQSYDQAIEDYSELIRLQPNLPANHSSRGVAYFRAGRLTEASADYNEALRLDPKYAPAYSNRAAVHFKNEDYGQAIKDCTEAIRINPKLDRAYWWRSQAYAKIGQAALAKADYEKSIQLNPANQQLQFDVEFAGRSFAPVVNRQEALRALRAFQLGSTLSAKTLYEINKYPVFEPVERLQNPVPKEARELIKWERLRHDLLEPEVVAAADRFLTAAKLSPAAQQAEGLEVQWLYGPVSSVKDRFESQDDLGGMRLIGRLIFKDGKEITAIFPVTFYPKIEEEGKRGRAGILWGADNFRIVVKLFATGTPKKDYAHQSFSVSNKEDGTQKMQPGLNVNEFTGMLVDPYIRSSSLGTRCFDCHSKGSNLNLKGDNYYYRLMKEKNYQAMKGFQGFLKLANELGASKVDREELESAMLKDPALLLPVDELIRANEEYWIRRYAAFKKRLSESRVNQPKQEKSSAAPLQYRDALALLASPLPPVYRSARIPGISPNEWCLLQAPSPLLLWSDENAFRADFGPDARR